MNVRPFVGPLGFGKVHRTAASGEKRIVYQVARHKKPVAALRARVLDSHRRRPSIVVREVARVHVHIIEHDRPRLRARVELQDGHQDRERDHVQLHHARREIPGRERCRKS